MDFIKDKISESTGSQNQSQNNQSGQSGSGDGYASKLGGLMGGGSNENQGSQNQGNQSGGGGFMSKMNNMAGGGQKGEKNEDMLDKGKNPLPSQSPFPRPSCRKPLLADN